MAAPRVIAKATGHAATVQQAADLRYLDETESRGRWGFSLLSREEIKSLIGKQRRIFLAEPGGKFERLPAEILPHLDHRGVMVARRSGTISPDYAARLHQFQAEGKIVAQRVVLGQMELRDDHGYRLARERGTVVPLTLAARVKAQELGWNAALLAEDGRPILSRVMRESIRGNHLSRRAVKSITSTRKIGKTIAAHNLAMSPHPRLLERIRRAGQQVDAVLEVAARRALEKMERKIKAKITAVCSTHLQDSTGIRPHLHIRMSAYDSLGRYIRLFDRKGGGGGSGAGGGGGRCLLQPEVERQVERIITRWEPRSRD